MGTRGEKMDSRARRSELTALGDRLDMREKTEDGLGRLPMSTLEMWVPAPPYPQTEPAEETGFDGMQ